MTVCSIITVTIGVDVIVQRQCSSQQQLFPWFHPFNREQNVAEKHNGLEWRARTTRTVSVFLDLSELKSDKSVARLGNCQVIINKCKSVGSLEEFYHKFWSITSSLGGPFDVAMLGCLSYSNLSSQTCRHYNDSGPGGSQTNNFNSFARNLLGHSSRQIFWLFL